MSEEPASDGMASIVRDLEFLALSSTAFARAMAGATILIAIATYADVFQTSGLVEGLFGTAFALVQFVIVLPLGRLIDLGNAKRYLQAGLVVNAIVLVGFMAVDSPAQLILARAGQGAAATLIWVTGTAVVGEISPDGSRGLWLGTYNQIDGVFSLLGYLTGGLLLDVFGFRPTYLALIGITALSTVMVSRYLRTDPGGRADPSEATGLETLTTLLGRSLILALVLFRFGYSLGKMAVMLFLPIYAKTVFGMSSLLIGAVLTGGKLIKALIQGKVGEYSDGVANRHYFIVAGASLFALGTALIPMASFVRDLVPSFTVGGFGTELTFGGPFFLLFFAYSLIGLGDSFRQPVSMTLFVEEGERYDAVASSLSLRTISWKLGEITGPVIVGVLWDLSSVQVAFWAAAGFIVLATVVLTAIIALGSHASIVESPTTD